MRTGERAWEPWNLGLVVYPDGSRAKVYLLSIYRDVDAHETHYSIGTKATKRKPKFHFE